MTHDNGGGCMVSMKLSTWKATHFTGPDWASKHINQRIDLQPVIHLCAAHGSDIPHGSYTGGLASETAPHGRAQSGGWGPAQRIWEEGLVDESVHTGTIPTY